MHIIYTSCFHQNEFSSSLISFNNVRERKHINRLDFNILRERLMQFVILTFEQSQIPRTFRNFKCILNLHLSFPDCFLLCFT